MTETKRGEPTHKCRITNFKQDATEQFNTFMRIQEVQEAKQDIDNTYRRA